MAGTGPQTIADRAADLRVRVQALIDGAAEAERELAERIEAVRPEHRLSAVNLVHYVWLRGRDIRQLQGELAELGLSSLGRLESRVMPTLQALAGTLDLICGAGEGDAISDSEMDLGPALLERNAEGLLGGRPQDRASRIMVTFPSEAATDPGLVRAMVDAGMDIARINCAHDGPEQWAAMIGHLEAADPRFAGRPADRRPTTGGGHRPAPDRSLIAMDLAGPKLRTGPIAPGPQVVKARPLRDDTGQVTQPAVVVLEADPAGETGEASEPTDDAVEPTDALTDAGIPPSATRIPVEDTAWLDDRQAGERIRFTDARGSTRALHVTGVLAGGRRPRVVTELSRTAYFVPGTRLCAPGAARSPQEDPAAVAEVGVLPARERHHLVRAGERVILTRSQEAAEPVLGGPHRIGCTLAQVFDDALPGQRIWFDDGKIGGTISAVHPDRLEVDVSSAGANGVKLRAGKGINLPDTRLAIPALTEDDLQALPFVVEHADIVDYSFVRTPRDVADLLERVTALGRADLDVVLKIETVTAFENLPQILLEAMRWRDVGVMIARGDLAVEAGFERLAEVQEEILWLCEAAHVPVIWATQVLERLAKTGLPSRAEVTDAAMSDRAEVVMLNKGPFIVEAIRFLHDVLERMGDHVSKKRALLRRLHAWSLSSSERESPGAGREAGSRRR